MISFANLPWVLLTYLIESLISPGCSSEFNVVYVQERKVVFVILQQNMKHTLSRTKVREIIKVRFPLSASER